MYHTDAAELERGLLLKPLPREEITHTVIKFAGDPNAAVAAPPAKKQRRSAGSGAGAGSSGSGGGGVSRGVAKTTATSTTTSAESAYARSTTHRETVHSHSNTAETLYSSAIHTSTGISTSTSIHSNLNSNSSITTGASSGPAFSSSTVVSATESEGPIVDLATVYPKMKSIVEHFWDLELPDRLVNGAFFGRITAGNYKDFGLETYRHDFTNLIFIKVRWLL